MKDLIKSFDYLGPAPEVYVQGRSRYKTVIGGLFSVLTSIAILGFIGYFFSILLFREDMKVETNITTKYVSQINLTDLVYSIRIADSVGNTIPSSVAYPAIYYYIRATDVAVRKTTKPKLCEESDFGVYAEDFNKATTKGEYYCMPPEFKEGKWLNGTYGDLNVGYTAIATFILKCNNNSAFNPSPGKCKSQEEIDKALSSPRVLTHFVNHEIDQRNVTSPFQPLISTVNFLMIPNVRYLHSFSFKNVIFNSDFGFVFEEKQSEMKHQAGSKTTDIYLGSNFLEPDAFGSLVFYKDMHTDIYLRTFVKLQAVLANIGGIVKLISMLAGLIMDYIHRKNLFVDIVECTMNLNPTPPMEKSVNNINSINKISAFNISQDAMMIKKEMEKKVEPPKKKPENKLNLSFMDYICPMFLLKNSSPKAKFLSKSIEMIKHRLSMENILAGENQLEVMKKILFDEKQSKIILHMSKLTYEENSKILKQRTDFSFDNADDIIRDLKRNNSDKYNAKIVSLIE